MGSVGRMTPGLYYGHPADLYHGGPGVSNSMLSSLSRSPFHCWALHLDPQRPPQPEKAGQLEGSLAHCLILEPETFDDRYAIGPSVNRNTKVWKEFVESSAGRIAIQQDQAAVARAQAQSVRNHPHVGPLLTDGAAEVSAYWIDEATGLLCRCRPDWWTPIGDDRAILLDVKTYSDASPDEFRRQVYRKGYHRQDAHYSTGFAKASRREVVAFVFVAVETAYPFACSACMVDDEGREIGRRDVRSLLDLFAKCQADNRWPGFDDTVHPISLPAWAA